ncbi:Alpha/Beta hydrolase protein [Phlyctochytrium arcticum]|nr:Alpha/Beta hydrolase protein [Phlyctochytrium arcticum]
MLLRKVLSLLLISPILCHASHNPSSDKPINFRLAHIFEHGYNPLTSQTYLRTASAPESIASQTYQLRVKDRNVKNWSEARGKEFEGLESVTERPILVPDETDAETVLTLGRMTANAYREPDDPTWINIPGWNQTVRWRGEGRSLAAYVFLAQEEEILVIVLKGTTLEMPIGGGPTSHDRFNDNIMFSCCCAKAGWSWKPICDCPTAAKECDHACWVKNSNFEGSYYNLAQTMYLAIKEWFAARTSIWLAGHSLGGALASLIALTNDLPAFAYEAPGDLFFATRLGLLPSLPPVDVPGEEPGKGDKVRRDYTKFLETLPIYHFGNNGDPIFLGQCTGPTSSCWWFTYALETACHIGYECVYDLDSPPELTKTSKPVIQDLSGSHDSGPRVLHHEILSSTQSSHRDSTLAQLSVKHHTIDFVITNLLEVRKKVPECKVTKDCLASECKEWAFN